MSEFRVNTLIMCAHCTLTVHINVQETCDFIYTYTWRTYLFWSSNTQITKTLKHTQKNRRQHRKAIHNRKSGKNIVIVKWNISNTLLRGKNEKQKFKRRQTGLVWGRKCRRHPLFSEKFLFSSSDKVFNQKRVVPFEIKTAATGMWERQ